MLVRVAVAVLVAWSTSASAVEPTAEQYVAHFKGKARIVPAGELKFGSVTASCRGLPTVLDPTLDDYSAAYTGFVIINPKLMANVTTEVKLWVYNVACGFTVVGPNKIAEADCYAVSTGRKQGWLTSKGLDRVCRLISPARERCAQMRKCFAEAESR